MRFWPVVAAALLSCGSAAAVPVRPDAEPAPGAFVSEIDRQLAGYGEWLMRLNATQEPLQQTLLEVRARWQAASATPNQNAAVAGLRPVIQQALVTIDASDAALAALDTPEFPALALDETLRPAQMVSEMRRYTGQLRTIVAGFVPLLDAVRTGDPRAAEGAIVHLMSNVRLLLQSQVLMTRAALAATPQDESAANVVEVQLLFFQASERIVAAWRGPAARGSDSALEADLLRFAERLDRTTAAGLARSDEETAQWRANLAAAEEEGDESSASISRRALTVLEIDRGLFPLGRELATVLRSHAAGFRGGAVEAVALANLIRALQPLRLRIDALVAREAAALAGR